MGYVFLVLAIACEVVGTSLLKSTEGFSRLVPTAACLGAYALAFVWLAQAVKDVQVGVAYALWSGLGTAAIVAIGVTFLNEPVNAAKVIGIVLIITGVVVLNLGGAH
ncbi:QacE family quaternary ammonium compound efflux SMR transporter [Actinomadura craniellae]|uniref:QacE family quaternary ammonium compound efflux SMR transporter n=1 Tax=Actinomadura craniellae TaxID=2231787 RepID=A0A365H9U0_9ACTN|nr:QacE family quaternary ammonium compound efflux SMR transporter [Actinomadura craniellae]